MTTQTSRGFDWIGLLFPVLFVAFIASVLGYRHFQDAHRYDEGADLAAKYGPAHFSEGVEEWAIRDFFQDKRDGVFVDVGASHHQIMSNTYFLEKTLGWHGIAIGFLSIDIELWEPKALAGFDIARFRPALVWIESQPEVRQEILNYFAAAGYVAVAKYLRADSRNLYFQPFGKR